MIRKAKQEDVMAISKIHVDGWRATYKGIVSEDFLNSMNYTEQEAQWKERYFDNKNTTEVILVVEDEKEKVAGFIVIETVSKNPLVDGSIDNLYIAESHHNKGYGTLLFKEGVEVLKKSGAKTFDLGAFKENKKACSFYEKLGGQPYKEKICNFSGAEVIGIGYMFNC